jgi:hypothetical protein
MIVEEVQMPAGKAINLRQRCIDRLRVEGSSPLEECLLVAEVTDVRAAA